MCVFVSRPMNIVTFFRKNADHPKRVVDFLRERDTFWMKSWKSFRILTKKVTTTTVNLGNRRGFCVWSQISSFFIIFSFFSFFIFLNFFRSFIFLIFSCFSFFSFFHFFSFFSFFHFFNFFFIVFIFLQFFHFFSFFIFHNFSSFFFFFFFSGLIEIRFFFGLNCFKISCNLLKKKKHFFEPSRVYLFGPSFFFSCLFFHLFLNVFMFFF